MTTKQLNFPATDAHPTFGAQVRARLEAIAKEKGNLTFSDIERVIDEMHAAHRRPATVRKRDARNALLASLVSACGLEPNDLTDEAARVAAISLADILRICPNADGEEFERRVRCYRRKYSGAAVTPRAICVHWHEFPAPAAPKADPYTAPINWQEKLPIIAELENMNLERLQEMALGGWLEIPIWVREMIVKLP